MECWRELTFTPTNLPPLLCNYTPRTAAEAIWRLHALLHHGTCQGKQWPRGLLMAQDPFCLHTVCPCSAQDGSGGTALLVPFSLVSKGETGSNPFPKSMNILCWYCKLQPLNPAVNWAMRGKAVQIECKQGATFCESAFGSKWLCLNVLIK